jgi:magnesium transporter
VAVVLSVLSWVKVMFLSQGRNISVGFSLAKIEADIGSAPGLQVVIATLIGTILSIGAARFKLNPAVVASTALNTIVDITGLTIYFMTAKMMLGLREPCPRLSRRIPPWA